MAKDDTLYFSALQPEGRLIHKIAWKKLRPKLADFSTLPSFPFAAKLSAGEPQTPDEPFRISKPKPYSKLAHLFRFHTWLPVYVNYDGIESLSLSRLTEDAGLGATAFWQNDLGTSYGFAGYHAAYKEGAWRHTLHGKWTYSGLYPVFEASVDFNERDARNYFLAQDEEQKTVSLKAQPRQNAHGGVLPSLSASLRTYIPWNFSSGGSLRGIVPTAAVSMSNDRFEGNRLLYRSVVSLRAYDMERTPDSRVYPRLGIGAEAGYSFRWTKNLFAPSAYAYLYGYLPGLHETHGLRWSVLGVKRFDGMYSEAYANVAPRGYQSAVLNRLASYEKAVKGALDYKLPLIPVDRALLGPVAYLRNFELTLHGDYTAFASPQKSGALFSAGADLAVVLGNLLWIPYPTRIGVSYNYNGGSSYADFAAQELPLERHVFSMIFSVEM